MSLFSCPKISIAQNWFWFDYYSEREKDPFLFMLWYSLVRLNSNIDDFWASIVFGTTQPRKALCVWIGFKRQLYPVEINRKRYKCHTCRANKHFFPFQWAYRIVPLVCFIVAPITYFNGYSAQAVHTSGQKWYPTFYDVLPIRIVHISHLFSINIHWNVRLRSEKCKYIFLEKIIS